MDGIGENLPSGYEIGFFIGAERESRSKAAEISTHCLVIGGSMIFTYLSAAVDPNSTSRIGAQLVTGSGFSAEEYNLEERDRQKDYKPYNRCRDMVCSGDWHGHWL
jgi:hypothetical protein